MFTLERYLLYMYMQFVQTHIILLCMYMYAYIVYCICLYRPRSLLYTFTQLCLRMYCMHIPFTRMYLQGMIFLVKRLAVMGHQCEEKGSLE